MHVLVQAEGRKAVVVAVDAPAGRKRAVAVRAGKTSVHVDLIDRPAV